MLGSLKRNKKRVAAAAWRRQNDNRLPKIRTIQATIKVWRRDAEDGTYGGGAGGYSARVCPKGDHPAGKIDWSLSPERRIAKSQRKIGRCGTGAGSTPTKAVKKALMAMARSLK